MTGAAEMRRVIVHASEGVLAAIDAERARDIHRSPRTALMLTMVSLSYARGVLDLLGTYLTDAEPTPAAAPAADAEAGLVAGKRISVHLLKPLAQGWHSGLLAEAHGALIVEIDEEEVPF